MAVSATDQYAYINLQGQVVRVEGGEVNDQGAYSAAAFYVIGDVVEYLNSLYICLAPNSAQPPTAVVDPRWSAFVKTTGQAAITVEELYQLYLEVLQIAVNGTNTANLALETAWYGTQVALDALYASWNGTSTGSLALQSVNDLTIGSVASNGTDLTIGRSGSVFQMKTMIAGDGIIITDYGTAVEVIGQAAGEINTASSAGGESLVLAKSGVDLPFKGIEAGSNVQISSTGTTVVISAGTTLASDGEAYTFVGGNSSPTLNGQQLITAYAAAKAKTPHSSALAADNRYTVFLMPGQYSLTDGALDLDTDYIDLIGLSEGRAAYLTSSGDTLQVTSVNAHIRLANMTIHTSAAATNSETGKHAYSNTSVASASTFEARNILFTSDNNYNAMRAQVAMYGTYIDCECDVIGGFNCAFQTWSSGVGLNGDFIRCKAQEYSFGATFNVSQTVTMSGNFIDCEALEDSFGKNAGFNTTMSGLFKGCVVNSTGGDCFGHTSTAGRTVTMSGIFLDCVDRGNGFCFGSVVVNGNITMTGVFINCSTAGAGFGTSDFSFGSSTGTRTISGLFQNCRTANHGFGGGPTGSGTTTLSGRFISCVAEGSIYCFGHGANADASGYFLNCRATGEGFGGGQGVASGTFIGCLGGDGAFGGRNATSATGGTASGTFVSCVGGQYSFGGVNPSGSTPGTMSGTMLNCTLTGLLFATVTGKIENSRIEATGSNENAVILGSSGRLYSCTLIKTGTGYSITGSGAVTAKVAHCRMNSGPDPGFTFTNSIETPYNVVDSDIA